ncbi:MAG: hypothetical protein R3B99_23610 [Polyangiales bacterium]
MEVSTLEVSTLEVSTLTRVPAIEGGRATVCMDAGSTSIVVTAGSSMVVGGSTPVGTSDVGSGDDTSDPTGTTGVTEVAAVSRTKNIALSAATPITTINDTITERLRLGVLESASSTSAGARSAPVVSSLERRARATTPDAFEGSGSGTNATAALPSVIVPPVPTASETPTIKPGRATAVAARCGDALDVLIGCGTVAERSDDDTTPERAALTHHRPRQDRRRERGIPLDRRSDAVRFAHQATQGHTRVGLHERRERLHDGVGVGALIARDGQQSVDDGLDLRRVHQLTEARALPCSPEA